MNKIYFLKKMSLTILYIYFIEQIMLISYMALLKYFLNAVFNKISNLWLPYET